MRSPSVQRFAYAIRTETRKSSASWGKTRQTQRGAWRAGYRRWLGRFSIHHAALLSVDKYNRHNNAPGSISLKQLASARFALAIEDSAPMAHFLVEHTGARVALMDRPWNRQPAAASHPRITRVHTWPQIHRLSLELGVGSSPGGS